MPIKQTDYGYTQLTKILKSLCIALQKLGEGVRVEGAPLNQPLVWWNILTKVVFKIESFGKILLEIIFAALYTNYTKSAPQSEKAVCTSLTHSRYFLLTCNSIPCWKVVFT